MACGVVDHDGHSLTAAALGAHRLGTLLVSAEEAIQVSDRDHAPPLEPAAFLQERAQVPQDVGIGPQERAR